MGPVLQAFARGLRLPALLPRGTLSVMRAAEQQTSRGDLTAGVPGRGLNDAEGTALPTRGCGGIGNSEWGVPGQETLPLQSLALIPVAGQAKDGA